MNHIETISECVKMLEVDGENTKAIVKAKLEGILKDVCCMCPGDVNGVCPGIPGTPHPEPEVCRIFLEE